MEIISTSHSLGPFKGDLVESVIFISTPQMF